MTEQQQNDIIEMVTNHPDIGARIFELCNLVKNSSGEFTTADAAEEHLIKEIRKLGLEVLQGWATTQSEKVTAQVAANKEAKQHSKKKSHVIQPLES